MNLFSILLTFVILACSANADIFTNSASVDSFTRAAAPTLNYGGAGALAVSGPNSTNGTGVTNGVFNSFIRFNTAAMVTHFNSLFGTNNWIINGATLQVTEQGAPANTLFNRGTGVFWIRWIANDSWIEGTGTPTAPTTNGIAYNNEVALLNSNTDASLGTFTNAGVDGTLNFPLALPVAFANDARAGGEVGLYLTAIDPGIGFTMDSRSVTTATARPFLQISAVPQPGIIGINLSGTAIVLTCKNGTAGGKYYALTSTNLALPLNQWIPAATNVLTGNGNFTVVITNGVNANGGSPQFYTLKTQ